MKKFLFTLATLIAAGFAANAACPQFAFAQDEVEVVPGGDAVTVNIVLTADANEQIKGAQFQWVMRDAAGEVIPSDVIVVKQNLGTPRVPNYQWFRSGVVMDDMGVPVASSNPQDGKYRLLLANTATNIIMMGDELAYYTGEGIEPVLCSFQLQAVEGWEGEFATLTLECNTLEYAQETGLDEYPNKIVGTEAVYVLEDGAMSIKIKNPNFVPAEDKDLTGEIMFGEMDENGTVAVWYEGPEEVTLTVTINGEVVELVDGTFTLPDYGTYEVYVTANAEGYKEESRMKIFTWEEPVVEQTAAPVVSFEMRGEELWCVITGEGDIYVDGQNCGPAPVEFLVTTQTTEDQEGNFSVYAIADGKTQSEIVEAAWTCEAKTVEPVYTPEPDVTIDVNDDNIVITVEGEGEIHVYVDGVELTEPYTLDRGDADKDVVITVTAQAEGMEMTTVTIDYTIPAKEVEPVDPGDHTVGKWVVFIDKDGNEQWYKLTEHEAADPADQDQAETSVALTYSIYGAFDYYGGAERPNVDFFFVVDGVKYGPAEDETVPVWGQANDNPLVEGENFWAVPVGYKYTVGIVTNTETGEMFMQISQGIFVGIDEMNADKAIAGVRYFNMAGQEMKEANGMTIVVTTYTDGTTSAVKVMK